LTPGDSTEKLLANNSAQQESLKYMDGITKNRLLGLMFGLMATGIS